MAKEKPVNTPKKLRSSYISSVVSITLVLFVVGLLGLIAIQARSLSSIVKENLQLSVFLNDNVRETQVKLYKAKLLGSRYVKSAIFISKEEAAEKLGQDLGEDFISFLGYNPLFASIDVRLKSAYANPDSIRWIEQELKKDPIVREVYYQESVIDLVNNNLDTAALALLIFSALLAVVAVTLINNTIRLALYSQRFIIKSMQLVGATKAFIRKPFLIRAIAQGLISGTLACIFLAAMLQAAHSKFPDLIVYADNIPLTAILFAIIIAAGAFISVLSTRMALGKYLKSTVDELYLR